MTSEEKKLEKAFEEATAEAEDDWSKLSAEERLERINTSTQRMAEERARMEQVANELKELEARRTLGGGSAGAAQEEKKGMTDKEYHDAVMKGEVPKE